MSGCTGGLPAPPTENLSFYSSKHSHGPPVTRRDAWVRCHSVAAALGGGYVGAALVSGGITLPSPLRGPDVAASLL